MVGGEHVKTLDKLKLYVFRLSLLDKTNYIQLNLRAEVVANRAGHTGNHQADNHL